MKRLFSILLLATLFSCEAPKGERERKEGYSIVVIQECEYIEVSFALGVESGYYSLTHKGNCKNHSK